MNRIEGGGPLPGRGRCRESGIAAIPVGRRERPYLANRWLASMFQHSAHETVIQISKSCGALSEAMNRLVRSRSGAEKIRFGGPLSTTTPPSRKIT